MNKRDVIDSVDLIKEAVEDTIKHRALLFFAWMQQHYTGTIPGLKIVQLYDEFNEEYKKMMAAKPKKEI